MRDGNENDPGGRPGPLQGRVVGIIAKPLPESIRQSRAMLPRFAGFAKGMQENSEPQA